MKEVKLVLQDGKEFLTMAEVFDLREIVTELNDRTTGEYIVIGNLGINKYVIRYFGETNNLTPVNPD